jgi:hypothetical protein
MCHASVSHKSAKQECPRKSVKQEFFTRVSCMSIQKKCETRVSNKSVLQERFRVSSESVKPACRARVSQKIVLKECFTRVW